MKEYNWVAFLLIGLIFYTGLMFYLIETANIPMLAEQINNSIIIGLLVAFLFKINEMKGR